jgi:hypothetical protein
MGAVRRDVALTPMAIPKIVEAAIGSIPLSVAMTTTWARGMAWLTQPKKWMSGRRKKGCVFIAYLKKLETSVR